MNTWSMKNIALLAAMAAVALAPAEAREDIANSSDHPLVGRYEGSVIKLHKVREYAEEYLPRAAISSGNDQASDHSVKVTGKLTKIYYQGPPNRSALEVVRNFQKSLEKNEFSTVFFCAKSECGSDSDFWEAARGGINIYPAWESNTYVLMKKEQADGDIYAAIYATETGSAPLKSDIIVRVAETKPIDLDKIVVVKADQISGKIGTEGRVALYAIEFDFDSDTLRPSSDAQIAEIASFLKANPSQSVLIVGHTDMKGTNDYNTSLSERRAKAVVDKLVSAHGIARNRLSAVGVGAAAPVASNRTENGRARNRRVEIVDTRLQ